MSSLFWVHALAMGFAWLVVAPFGMQISRYGRMRAQLSKTAEDPAPAGKAAWFVWHRALQTLATVLVIGGLVSVVAAVDSDGMEHLDNMHSHVGTVTILLLVLQVCGAVLRPSHGARWRRAWEAGHHANGYALWILSAASCILGSSRMDVVRSRYSFEPVRGNTWIVVVVAAASSAASMAAIEAITRFTGYDSLPDGSSQASRVTPGRAQFRGEGGKSLTKEAC